MTDVTGDFEIHLTVGGMQAGALSAFAEEHGLKFTHVVLDRGDTPSQPMLTLTGSGSLEQQRDAAKRWAQRLEAAGLQVRRVKIEAAPWCKGVPHTDEQALRQPAIRYFEHHVKVLLPADAVPELLAVGEVADRHGARLSRNARRVRDDGVQERFVTQRCRRVGLSTARSLLDQLVAELRQIGHEPVAVEQEYVVHDNRLELDAGWLVPTPGHGPGWLADDEERKRTAAAGRRGYPATYRPLPAARGVRQRAAFDPALKQYDNAYRAGEPQFADGAVGLRWKAARRAAMIHLLNVVLGTPWADRLVLRGSVAMPAWCGAAAREPGDVDFVVTPFSMAIDSPEARAMLQGVMTALRESPGAGLDPDGVFVADIWTYERADGRRLVLPFTTTDAITGTVQVDFVFNEHLPIAPTTLVLPGVHSPVRAATAELSLAWKLMWLATDMYPQGKDLYDAVLLAEHTTVDAQLVRDLLRPELGDEADTFTAETVLGWDVDWSNFTDEYPGIAGGAELWRRRLALALGRAWSTA